MGFSLSKTFNKVARFVVHPSAALNKFGFDLFDKGLQDFGFDLFGNKQQDINNEIAKENNTLQKDAFNFNKSMATNVYKINKDIAYNGSQIKSSDMAKAGLNPLAGVNSSPQTVSSSNVESPNLSQSNLVAQTGLQKIQTVAGLAMQAKQLQSSLASSAIQNKAVEAQTRYQELVNDYFDKHDVLPTQQNEWLAQILPLIDKIKPTSIGQQISDSSKQVTEKITDTFQKASNEVKTAPIYKIPVTWRVGLVDSMRKYPSNEKGFLDWTHSNTGIRALKKIPRNDLRDLFMERQFWSNK